jgi:hypothetical protein
MSTALQQGQVLCKHMAIVVACCGLLPVIMQVLPGGQHLLPVLCGDHQQCGRSDWCAGGVLVVVCGALVHPENPQVGGGAMSTPGGCTQSGWVCALAQCCRHTLVAGVPHSSSCFIQVHIFAAACHGRSLGCSSANLLAVISMIAGACVIRGGLACRYAHQRYNKPLLYITENGVSAPREAYVPLRQVVRDTFRLDYYRWGRPGRGGGHCR